MLTLYTWLLRLLFPFILLRLAWRGVRNPDYWRRIPERFGFVAPRVPAHVIWIHAVSVGEVRATVPLVRALMERYPEHRLLMTTMTPTGSAQVRELFNGQVWHCYVPYDYPGAVNRFLNRTQPVFAMIMETELWPNIFHRCRARGIPLLISNVRMSQASMQKYQRFARFTRATLNQASCYAAQSSADATRLLALGAEPTRVQVTGSIKFELGVSASLREAAEVLRRAWGKDRPVWLAASTHAGEEELVLAAFAEIKRQPRLANVLLVLVPRHPERFTPVAKLCRKHGFKTTLRSEQSHALDEVVEILLGDTMGELPLFYGAADVAYIGGSLVPTGGHNLLEACALGKPVVMGPHMFNFQEISQMALKRRAAVRVESSAQLAATVAEFLINPDYRDRAGEAGQKMVEENRGALAANMRLIEILMGNV